MGKPIFRKQALEKLSSPARLDQLMAVTSPATWVALAGAGILLLVVILWSICGTLQTTVDADGVFTRPGGVAAVSAPFVAEVKDILVQDGQLVKRGDPLMRLASERTDGNSESLPLASPLEGRVVGIAVRVGDLVTDQELLAAVERLDRPLRAVVYVAAGEGNRVRAGTAAQVSVGSSGGRGFRPLSGRVEHVGPLPATPMAMRRTLQSEQWAASLSQQGPMLEVTVKLDDERAAEAFSTGTPCRVRLVVDQKRPIQLILGYRAG